MSLSLDLDVRRPGFHLRARLDEVDGVVTLLGPSGVGKTTLLHAVAGLVPATGTIHLDGRDLAAVPTWQRGVGLVFQDVRLLPHLSVRANLAFGAVDDDEVEPLAARLGVAGLLGRRPATLSGGEARRVAVARTLLTRPRVLLLDEPLVGLDAARRADLLGWLGGVVRAAGVPALWVTHDRDEARTASTRQVLLVEDADGTVTLREDP